MYRQCKCDGFESYYEDLVNAIQCFRACEEIMPWSFLRNFSVCVAYSVESCFSTQSYMNLYYSMLFHTRISSKGDDPLPPSQQRNLERDRP